MCYFVKSASVCFEWRDSGIVLCISGFFGSSLLKVDQFRIFVLYISVLARSLALLVSYNLSSSYKLWLALDWLAIFRLPDTDIPSWLWMGHDYERRTIHNWNKWDLQSEWTPQLWEKRWQESSGKLWFPTRLGRGLWVAIWFPESEN